MNGWNTGVDLSMNKLWLDLTFAVEEWFNQESLHISLKNITTLESTLCHTLIKCEWFVCYHTIYLHNAVLWFLLFLHHYILGGRIFKNKIFHSYFSRIVLELVIWWNVIFVYLFWYCFKAFFSKVNKTHFMISSTIA